MFYNHWLLGYPEHIVTYSYQSLKNDYSKNK